MELPLSATKESYFLFQPIALDVGAQIQSTPITAALLRNQGLT